MLTEQALLLARSGATGLDIRDLNERFEGVAQKRAEIRAGLRRAETRLDEIATALDAPGSVPAAGMADALLTGTPALSAHQPLDQMRSERDALRAAMTELRNRDAALRGEEDTIRSEAAERASQALEPLSDAIKHELGRVAGQMLAVFASARALQDAVGGYADLALRASQAASGVVGMDKALPTTRLAKVPDSVSEVLSLLATKGDALKSSFRTEIKLS